ncbi:PAS domain S-box protein [Ideonella sp. A 288]|uniref:PAS domain S-box protein n=1 Tax=Ideonella sp. A 288 TaxID=1962181 RepID=UPI001302FEF8|nr:PAS domain S-box protein [Ideonella sp. A 288]
MDWLTTWFAREGFLPHGTCFTWTPTLLWAIVGADAVIAMAYFSIPLALGRFVQKRPDVQNRWMVGLFAAFILACGTTHLMDIWTVWQPDYGALALSKLATAAVSLATAVSLWWLIPRALKIPTVAQLQAAVTALEAEVGRRRTAEQHLADIEQSLAITLASIEAGFIATDRAGRVTHMNAVAERVTGWSQAEAMGQSLWTVFARDDRPAGLEQENPIEVMRRQGVTIEQPHHVTAVARDGRRTPVEVRAALARADDGAVRGLAMVFRDMTRLNNAEAERHRLAAIVDSSYDAIIGKTLDGTITSWNAAAQALFGHTAAQAVGASIQMLIPPEHVAEERQILDDLAQGRQVAPFETVRMRRDGRRIDVSVTVSPIRDATGRIVGASKIARDITQQRQAAAARLRAERLEAENRQIQAANRLKSQFLANMSHELRTPLNAIIGFSELLHSGAVPVDDPKHTHFLGHIGTSGRHLLQLINDVLDLSKVEAGKFDFHPEPVNLARLVTEVRDVLVTSAMRKQLRWTTDIDEALTDLVIDPARFKQVLYNYLSNAIKFTPQGGRITLRARGLGPSAFRLEVHDTGVGIAESDLARLFVEFQQLDAGHSKQHQGTGLGLALTRRLVQAQGGRVGVRSTPGVGSVFYLDMPRVTGPSAEIAPRWLVIEDDSPLQAEVVQGLQGAGFDVDVAANAEQAVHRAGGQAYDAITLDLQLPDQQGLGALARIRHKGPSRESPVRALTMPTGASRAATFAIANLLGKPLRTDEVVASMARLPTPEGRRLKVMVIDDDPLALELMEAALRELHIDAIGRLDARGALAELEQQPPDALILDLMMPGFDGFATLDALRRLPAGQALPVFIWTSMLLTDDEVATLTRSAQAILGKGGGALAQVLEQLGRWRPLPAPADAEPR